jgi:hypothetical protein
VSGSDNDSPVHPAGVVLARRSNAGIHVTLLWAFSFATTAPTISSCSLSSPGQTLSGTNALSVFEHPYAYAAWRGVNYRTAA